MEVFNKSNSFECVMKKFFFLILTTFFLLNFIGCVEDVEDEEQETTLKIKNESSYHITNLIWNGMIYTEVNSFVPPGSFCEGNTNFGSGYVYFDGFSGNKYRTVELLTISKGEQVEFLILNSTIVINISTNQSGTLASQGEIIGLNPTTLKINNQSFTEITDVIWYNISFANSQFENSIKTGTSVTNTVDEGAGYIFFKRKSDPIVARTNEMIIIEKGDQSEFSFTDNTAIVEVNNPGNSGNLGQLNSTVVWWDDAEGELQPYFENQSYVGYYTSNFRSLPIFHDTYSTNTNTHFHPPKNGNRSIAVGGSNTAKLHIRINLEKNARLSFWYANINNSDSLSAATFSINGITERTWSTNINWSFYVIDLESGVNDIIWEKKDGHKPPFYYYLSLDDILIYYIE